MTVSFLGGILGTLVGWLIQSWCNLWEMRVAVGENPIGVGRREIFMLIKSEEAAALPGDTRDAWRHH